MTGCKYKAELCGALLALLLLIAVYISLLVYGVKSHSLSRHPIDLSVSVGDGWVDLNWPTVEPCSEHGKWGLRWRVGEKEDWKEWAAIKPGISGDRQHYTVRNLANWLEYSFQIRVKPGLEVKKDQSGSTAQSVCILRYSPVRAAMPNQGGALAQIAAVLGAESGFGAPQSDGTPTILGVLHEINEAFGKLSSARRVAVTNAPSEFCPANETPIQVGVVRFRHDSDQPIASRASMESTPADAGLSGSARENADPDFTADDDSTQAPESICENVDSIQGIAECLLQRKVPGYCGRILIEGHADSSGSASYNLDLSERRANAVYNRLIDNGICANCCWTFRLISRGESHDEHNPERDHPDNRKASISICQPIDQAMEDQP